MTHHFDYADKTKGERRERAEEKKRERMSQGKKAKLWAQIVQQLAAAAEAKKRAEEQKTED